MMDDMESPDVEQDLNSGDADSDRSSQDKSRAETVDLTGDNSLLVDISDALSERDKVKFTVHTKTSMTAFAKSEMSVTRQHEEFIWLHDRFEENDEYAGLIIPPAPPRPDFDASREKLQRLGDGEGTMTKEEFSKMKAELEAEYLATFKKTVAMHEVFLQRLAAHEKLRNDDTLRVFLEYDGDLNVRGKNKKEKVSGFFRTVTKTADEVLLANQKEEDEFFAKQKLFLVNYLVKIKDSTAKADKNTKNQKSVADSYIKLSTGFTELAKQEPSTNKDLHQFYDSLSEFFEKLRKLEGRMASDVDLKLSDTLRYYANDSSAARDLLYRRSRALVDYENANKTLEKARQKNKDVRAAEQAQDDAYQKFQKISNTARIELEEFNRRRIRYFRKNLIECAELQAKHSKAQSTLLRDSLEVLRKLDVETECAS